MGSWSKAIMGGDTPYDWMGFLLERFKIPQKYFHEGIGAKTYGARTRLKYQLKIIEQLGLVCAELEKRTVQNTAWLVLGVVLMRFGVEVNDVILGKIMEEALEDPWALEDEQRAEIICSYMDDLYKWSTIGYVEMELTDTDPGLINSVINMMVGGGPYRLANV